MNHKKDSDEDMMKIRNSCGDLHFNEGNFEKCESMIKNVRNQI